MKSLVGIACSLFIVGCHNDNPQPPPQAPTAQEIPAFMLPPPSSSSGSGDPAADAQQRAQQRAADVEANSNAALSEITGALCSDIQLVDLKVNKGKKNKKNKLERIMKRRMGAFKACYGNARAKSIHLKGEVLIRIEVSPSGKVEAARLLENVLGSEAGICMLEMIKTTVFPSRSGGPLVFDVRLSAVHC